MLESYFQKHHEDEIELAATIKRCLNEFILPSEKQFLIFIEFHEYELTPKRIYTFESKSEFSNFIGPRPVIRPRLIIEKREKFFSEFSGNEVDVGFSIKDCNVIIEYIQKIPWSINA